MALAKFYIRNIQNLWEAAILGKMLVRLKYYATYKVKKFEPLFYKIDKRLQKATICIGLQAEEIFSVKLLYKYIYIYNGLLLLTFSK